MKQDSGNLHLLVHTLTKHEKIFFRNQSKRWGDEKDYLHLFDYLLAKDQVNDQMIRTHFEGEAFLKRLPAVKNYLFNKILESLILMDRKRSMEGQIRERVEAAIILHKKGLIKASVKKLRKAAKLADATCNHRLQLEVIQVEKRLYGRYRVLDQEAIEVLYQKEEDILGMISSNNFFWQHSTLTYARLSAEGLWINATTKAYFEEVLEKEELISAEFARGALAQARRFNLEGLIQQQLGNNAAFLAASREVVAVFEEDELFRTSNLFLYSIGLDYLVIALIVNEAYEEALAVNLKLEKLARSKAMPKENASTLNNLDFRILARKFTIYCQQKKTDLAMELLPGIESLLEDGPEVEQAGQLELYFQVAGLYFRISRFEKSLDWIQKTMENANVAGRDDVYGYALLLQTMAYLELKDFKRAKNKLKVAQRYFTSRELAEGMPQILFNLFEALCTSIAKERDWKTARKGLKQFKDQFPHNRAVELFDFSAWVEEAI